MRFLHTFVAAAMVAGLVSGCDMADLPLVGQEAPPSAPTSVPGSIATVAPRGQSVPRSAEPTGAVPRSTDAPLPAVAPVSTLEPGLTSAVDQEERVLVELYRRVNPAVVSIVVAGRHPEAEGAPSSDQTIPFAQGSGFLYDDQGHIVTNNHVVEGAEAFQVQFADGTIATAQLVGTDPDSDLAVLKVAELPPETAPLALANSQAVEVGQTAVAIGNPFGLQNTLTVGVISGVGRSLSGRASREGTFSIPNVIQTDAAINPGNSGGPLLNIHGEVIGVNTAIRSESGVFEGVGYAVPSNALTRVVPALIRSGSYQHPWIGISMFAVTPLFADQFNLGVRQGVLVSSVKDGSPAATGGLRSGLQQANYNGQSINYDGDIITAVNDQPVRSSDDIISYLEQQTSVGDTIELTVVREGDERRVPITLTARP